MTMMIHSCPRRTTARHRVKFERWKPPPYDYGDTFQLYHKDNVLWLLDKPPILRIPLALLNDQELPGPCSLFLC